MLEVVSRNILQELDFFELHRKSPERYLALLESLGEGGNEQAKQEKSFDLLLALPQASLESRNRQLSASGWRTPADTDFFSALSQWQAQEACESVSGLPFCGGWFVLLGYEAAELAEPGLTLPPAPPGLPDALAVRCAGAVIRNRTSGECFLVAESEAGAAQMQADIDALATLVDASQANNAAPLCSTAISEDDPTVFLSGVHRVLDYLHAGDAYQVNLSREWRATLNAADGYH
ncbi:MAG: aminodeoxychorismate synthase, component I, partial [Sinobacteraceae bacterium]|nr:aminodeoxychorismate synthase, component I [Nevskiaceae bacterium]